MIETVIQAFEKFQKEIVNLDSDDSKKARSSRNWLIDQINAFPNKHDEFPILHEEMHINYGSFARKTKKRPLDDIDLMICLHAEQGNYIEFSDEVKIYVSENSKRLKKYTNDDSNVLNSRKIINKFVSNLSNIPQYRNAIIKRNLEAATLDLYSYDWVFDIVPCFFTVPDVLNKTYYLIPDGNGNWKKTDPLLDRERVTKVNTEHKGNILNIIRIMKYWNNRATMPSIGSYLLENMILDYYENKITSASSFVDLEIVNVLYEIHQRIFQTINDPKKIQGNLNNLSYDDKTKISNKAYADYLKALEARDFEKEKEHKKAINKWIEIFGNQFPKYDE